MWLMPCAEPAGLAGDPAVLPRQRAAELLHAHPGGRSGRHREAAVRGQHSQGRQVPTLLPFFPAIQAAGSGICMQSVLTLLLLEDSETNDVAVNSMLVDVQRLQR